MDPLSLAVGAVVLLVGAALGRVTRPVRRPAEPAYVCTCRHSLAYHDPTTSRCAREYVKTVNFVQEFVSCDCRRYVGPLPPAELDPAAVLRALRGQPADPEELP